MSGVGCRDGLGVGGRLQAPHSWYHTRQPPPTNIVNNMCIACTSHRYLIARNVKIGHINKHIGMARKINNFLESGAAEGSEVRMHAERMESWLGILEAQLSASMPSTATVGAPDIDITWEWTRRFAEAVAAHIDIEMLETGQIGYNTANNNQMALIALLVCGTEAPPCRLFHLKTVLHPSYNGKFNCSDPDCTTTGCMGNRLEVLYKEGCGPVSDISADEEGEDTDWQGSGGGDDEGGEAGGVPGPDNVGAGTSEGGAGSVDAAPDGGVSAGVGSWHFNWGLVDVHNVLVHSKNDRRGPRSELSYVFPEGILTKLLLAHIYQGHKVSPACLTGHCRWLGE